MAQDDVQGWNDLGPIKPSSTSFSGYKGTDKPDGTWWLTQIRKGIEYRKKAAFQGEWDTWRRYYRGEYLDGNVLPVNIFFKMIRTIVPRVFFRNPSISISSTKPGDDHYMLAQILERIDNKLIRQMKVKQSIKTMTQHALMYGTGIGKIGYGAQFTPTFDYTDSGAPDGKRKKHRFKVEYNDLVVPDMPWFMPVHPGSFIVPSGCVNHHDARWVAHWMRRHIDDVKDDPRLRHTSDINVNRAHASELMKGGERAQNEGLVDLVEIRDKKSGMVFVIAPYHNAKILYADHDEMMDGGHFPFLPLIFNEDDQYFWGVPDSKILEPQQRELNEVRTIMMKHRRASLIKLLVESGAMTPDEAEKLSNESVAPVVMVNEGGLTRIKTMEAANIPQGLLTMDALVQKDVQEILGLGSNQFGEYAPGSADRSATEANIVNQATQIRMDERRDSVADLLVDMFDQVNPILFELWKEEQVIDLVGPGGVQIWVQFRPEELMHGGYNVLIDPDSTLPETKQIKEQKAVQVYQLLSQNPLIEPHRLTGYLLRAFHGAEFDDMLISPQEAEMMKQQAMVQAGVKPGTPGASQQHPLTGEQYQRMLPALRSIQGGKGRVPQKG